MGRSVAVSLSVTGGYAAGTYTVPVRPVVVPRVRTVYVPGEPASHAVAHGQAPDLTGGLFSGGHWVGRTVGGRVGWPAVMPLSVTDGYAVGRTTVAVWAVGETGVRIMWQRVPAPLHCHDIVHGSRCQ